MSEWFRRHGLSFTLHLLLIGSIVIGIFPGFSTQYLSASDEPMIERNELATYLTVEAKVRDNPKISLEDMDKQIGEGPQQTYPLSRVKSYLEARTKVRELPSLEQLKAASGYQGPIEFPWVRLRRSYRDVLVSEDPTLQASNALSFDDLEGALISYSRDLRNKTDTWSMEAALIAPFSWDTGHTLRRGDSFSLARFGLVPSISMYRLSTNSTSKEEIDQLTYRLGLFAKLESGYPWLTKLTGRAFGTYVTDSEHDSTLLAGEFELEPQADFARKFKIGYRTNVIPKENPQDIHDTAVLAYQLRFLLHGEYGGVENTGEKAGLKEGDFFRLGPITQLDFKPFFHPLLTVSLRYSLLPALWGKDNHNSLFAADAEWALIKDEKKQRKISLKVSYLKGGLVLTEERAETLLLGVGITF